MLPREVGTYIIDVVSVGRYWRIPTVREQRRGPSQRDLSSSKASEAPSSQEGDFDETEIKLEEAWHPLHNHSPRVVECRTEGP